MSKSAFAYAENNGVDQLRYCADRSTRLVFRCRDSIVSIVSNSNISSAWIATVTGLVGFWLNCSQTPKTEFSRDEAQMIYGRGDLASRLEIKLQFKSYVMRKYMLAGVREQQNARIGLRISTI